MLKEAQAAFWLGSLFRHLYQRWDSSQEENEPEERDAMDWLMDDGMMRQWEEIGKDEEEITVKRK